MVRQDLILKIDGVVIGMKNIISLSFDDSAIRTIAKLSHRANEITEDIGARRLHTVLEKVLEDLSFEADSYKDKDFVVTSELVHEKLDTVVADDDLSRYIL